jgi:hypothetical protein
MNRPEHITKAAYEVAGISIRNIMPFTNMEAVKNYVFAVRATLFANYRNKKKIDEEAGRLQLPD